MKDVLEIKFNKKIYPQKYIFKAIEDFKKTADFKTVSEGNCIRVTMTGFDPGIREKLEGEFCNYLFHLCRRRIPV